MNVIVATLTISCALPLLTSPTFAQASAGGGATGVSGGAAGAGGAVSPSGNLAGSANARVGTALSTPAGASTAPSTVTPIGPINPGGISATPPGTVGRTFDRTTIGGAPIDTVTDPVGPQPVFRFPPGSAPGQDVVTNTPGLGAASTTFPGAPVGVGNTVGTNFARGLTNAVPREPVAINLPPGARVVTNVFGVSEAIVPPPVIIPTNAVGRGPTFESASDRAREVPQRTLPPRNPSIVRP